MRNQIYITSSARNKIHHDIALVVERFCYSDKEHLECLLKPYGDMTAAKKGESL